MAVVIIIKRIKQDKAVAIFLLNVADKKTQVSIVWDNHGFTWITLLNKNQFAKKLHLIPNISLKPRYDDHEGVLGFKQAFIMQAKAVAISSLQHVNKKCQSKFK